MPKWQPKLSGLLSEYILRFFQSTPSPTSESTKRNRFPHRVDFVTVTHDFHCFIAEAYKVRAHYLCNQDSLE